MRYAGDLQPFHLDDSVPNELFREGWGDCSRCIHQVRQNPLSPGSVATAVAPAAGSTFEMGVLGMQPAPTQGTLGKDAEPITPIVSRRQHRFITGLRRHRSRLARCTALVGDPL